MLCKCDREFNPNSPLHKPHGLYEQCNVCGMQLDKKEESTGL